VFTNIDIIRHLVVLICLALITVSWAFVIWIIKIQIQYTVQYNKG